MDDLAYYKAATPEPWTILGLNLHPFSLGHLHLLHRFESAFVDPDKDPDIVDLLLACFICSRTYRETLNAMEGDPLEPFRATWSRQLIRPTWLHRFALREPVVCPRI